MTVRDQITYHYPTLTPGQPATPSEAQMLSRLAESAIANALADGIVLTRKQAFQRIRENLAYVRAMEVQP